jgi:hypothetical protein
MITNDAGKKIPRDMAARLFPDQPSSKDIKINPNRAMEMIGMFNNTGWPNLDEDLCIRIFSWYRTTIFSHPTCIVTSGPLMHFGVATRGLLRVIIGAKSSMMIREKQVVSGRWHGILEWIGQLYWVILYFSCYEPVISATHFHIIVYSSHS